MSNKLDQIIGLYAGNLDEAEKRTLLVELNDKDSEAAKLVEAIRVLARSRVDLHKIPGMQEIAALEAQLESMRGSEGDKTT